MITFKQKEFGVSDFFSRLFKVKGENTSTTEAEVHGDTSSPEILRVTFKELSGVDPWPAIVTINLKEFGGPEEIKEFENAIKGIKLIREKDHIKKVYILSDNIRGKSGATAMCIEFSKGTEISSGVRLGMGDRIKWPEDFFSQYSGWYKSGSVE